MTKKEPTIDLDERMALSGSDRLDPRTEAVWAVYPKAGDVHVYTADGAIKRGWDAIIIDMTPFMPGLPLSLNDMFWLPELE